MYLIHAQVMFILLTIIKNKFELPINTITSFVVLVIAIVIGIYFGKLEVKLHEALKEYTKSNYKILYKYMIIICGIYISVWVINYSIDFCKSVSISNQIAQEFDSSKILLTEKNAGWVDDVSEKNASVNQYITIKGWAVDPDKIRPAKDVILVIDGKVIPSEVEWYSRQGLVNVFNSDSVLNSGWELKFNTRHLKGGSNRIEVYAITEEERYILLKIDETKENHIITIN